MIMKRFLLFALTALSALLLSACATVNLVSVEPEFNDMWVGHEHAELIKAYGAPDREVSDGEGGVILVYERTTVSTSTQSDSPFFYHYPFGPTFRTTTRTDRDYVHFYVNASGLCYQVKTNQMRPVDRNTGN